MRILIVEDDAVIVAWVRRVFTDDGYAVDAAGTSEDALAAVRTTAYDLALVDLGLPGSDGLSVVRELRVLRPATPVLILTGRDLDADVAHGLEAGADDYITKPVSATVLRARVRAVLRRVPPADPEGPAEVAIGRLVLDRRTCRLRGPAGEASLTAKELALLGHLLPRHGQIVPREQLLERVWGYQFDPGTNVVEVALSRLRQKLGGVCPECALRTVRGLGVVLTADETAPA